MSNFGSGKKAVARFLLDYPTIEKLTEYIKSKNELLP
jgi:hypothetical protein